MEINRAFVLLLICLPWSSASSDKWIRHGKKVYLEVPSLRQPNYLAYCTARNSNGVDIEDDIENNFVKQLVGGAAFWIGIYSISSIWYQWEGAAITYWNWGPESPGPYTAATINNGNSGDWSDEYPNSNYPGVCQRELSLYPNKATYVPLLTSAGNDNATFFGTASSRSDCASICHKHATCTCFGYDKTAKNCATFNWQPVIQPNSVYFCFKETM